MSNLNFTSRPNPYENDIFVNQPESLLRPGGLSLTKCLADTCAFSKGAKVIDLGCGSGITVKFLQDQYGIESIGIDLSSVLLNHGKKHTSDLRLIQARGDALPVTDCTFDGVFAECSLSEMHYADSVFAEIDRILAYKGKLCISDIYIRNPEHVSALRNILTAGCISGALTYPELLQKLRQNGYNVLAWEDQSALLKEFIARCIMEHGSINLFLQTTLCEEDGKDLLAAIKKAGIGYYWLVAEKTNINED
jgi:arsenite methyltransferase